MSPGRIDYWKDRCRECGGIDPLSMGLPIHKPTCSESPGYLQARMREAVDRQERRARREAWARSAEAKRVRNLRTISPAADVVPSHGSDGASPVSSTTEGETVGGVVDKDRPAPPAGDR